MKNTDRSPDDDIAQVPADTAGASAPDVYNGRHLDRNGVIAALQNIQHRFGYLPAIGIGLLVSVLALLAIILWMPEPRKHVQLETIIVAEEGKI